MGAPRLRQLEKLMPPATQLLGLDEHTALIVHTAQSHATVQGVGSVTIRRSGREWVFGKGDRIPLRLLRGEADGEPDVAGHSRATRVLSPPGDTTRASASVWDKLHAMAGDIRTALNEGADRAVGGGLLEMEGFIWQALAELEEEDGVGAAREIFRELLASLLSQFAGRPPDRESCLRPVVDALLTLRERLRAQKKWEEADAVRDCLAQAGVAVEDTPEGARWSIGS